MSPLALRRYRAERLLREEFERLRGRVLLTVAGRLRASGVRLDASDLEACYALAWHGLYTAVLEGQEIANPTGWLVLVTFRRAIEEHRARARIEREGATVDSPRGARRAAGRGQDGASPLVGAGAEYDLAAELDDRMRLRQLFEGLRGRLSARELQAAALCYLQGLSRSEAAARMGVSEARMRKLMEGAGPGRPGVAAKVGALVETIRSGGWCEEQGSLMRGFAYGVLAPGGERYQLALIHNSECPACRAYVRALRGLAAILPPVPCLLHWALGAGAAAGTGVAGSGAAIGTAAGSGAHAGAGMGASPGAAGGLGAGRGCTRRPAGRCPFRVGRRGRERRRRGLAVGGRPGGGEARRGLSAGARGGGGLRRAHREGRSPAGATPRPHARRRGRVERPGCEAASRERPAHRTRIGRPGPIGCAAARRRRLCRRADVGWQGEPGVRARAGAGDGWRTTRSGRPRATAGRRRLGLGARARRDGLRSLRVRPCRRDVAGRRQRAVRPRPGRPARVRTWIASGPSARRESAPGRSAANQPSRAGQPFGKTFVRRASASGLPRGRSLPVATARRGSRRSPTMSTQSW